MAIKVSELGYVMKAINAGFTSVMAQAAKSLEKLNAGVPATSRWRQAGENLAVIGAGMAAAGGVIAYGLRSAIDEAAEVDAAMRHLGTALDAGAAGTREYAETANAAIASTTASLAVAKGNMGDARVAIEESLHAFARGKLQTELGASLATFNNGSLDVIGSLVSLRARLGEGALSVVQFQRAAKALEIRGQRALAIDVGDLEQFWAIMHDPAVTSGAAMQGATTMLAVYNEQMGMLGRKWAIFKDTIVNQLRGPLPKVGHYLSVMFDMVNRVATAHPQITKFVVTFVAIAAVVAVVVGGVVALVGGFLALASLIVPIGVATAGAFLAITGAVAGVGAALITWGGSIKAFFQKWGLEILGFSVAPWAMLPYEITKHWEAIKTAAKNIAHGIAEFFVGHSPIPQGPLHELNLGKQIAWTLQRAPLVAAAQRVALATLIAAPMMAGGVARAAGSGAAPVVINYTVNISGVGNGADLVTALEKHKNEIERVVRKVIERQDRKSF